VKVQFAVSRGEGAVRYGAYAVFVGEWGGVWVGVWEGGAGHRGV
jgi:hypothetical protein